MIDPAGDLVGEICSVMLYTSDGAERRRLKPRMERLSLTYAMVVAAKCLAQFAGSTSPILLAWCVATLTSTFAR
jgi:hypothetical protein